MAAGRKKKRKSKTVDEPGAEVEHVAADRPSETDPGTNVTETEVVDRELSAEELERLRADAAKAAEYLDLAQRTAAELQNLQQRLARDKETARRLAVRDVLRSLLPSIDNLERALSAEGSEDSRAIIDGVRLVYEEIQRTLKERGLEVVEPTGERLDPNLHEAVFSRATDEVPEGTILETFEKGYRLGDLIVRPARVIVASPPPTEPAADQPAQEEAKSPTEKAGDTPGESEGAKRQD